MKHILKQFSGKEIESITVFQDRGEVGVEVTMKGGRCLSIGATAKPTLHIMGFKDSDKVPFSKTKILLDENFEGE